ncbi:MAG: hypothetical protein ACM3ST_04090 [Bdellovibrio bacteriovorus]
MSPRALPWGLLRLTLILLVMGLSGCASGLIGLGGPRPPDGLSRDQLLSLVASCHLLRVGQNLDNRVTDATVVSAVQQFGLSFETVIRRANQLVLRYQNDGPALAERATQACSDLALLTGTRPALVRLEESGRPRAVWLRLEGAEITEGFADRVIRELRDKKAVGLIINSPGGSVHEARKLGRYLRANGLRSAVDQMCVSACIDVLAGGAERYALRGARLGIHQSRVPSRYSSHEGGQLYVADSFRYLREMGVDADVAIAAASVPNDKLLLIPLADALETRLITAVVDRL